MPFRDWARLRFRVYAEIIIMLWDYPWAESVRSLKDEDWFDFRGIRRWEYV